MISTALHLDQQLEEVIQILTTNFLIECIYRSDFHGSAEQTELVLLLSNKYVNMIGEITPKMVCSIKHFDSYHLKCFVAFQTREKIKKGNLFLFSTCQPENLVYQKAESKFSPIPKDFDPWACFALFQTLQEREAQKTNEFKDGYYHFKARSNYAMAAFMIHQVLELTYRNLEIMLMGKDKITHSISCHQATLSKIHPYGKPVFDVDQRDDDDLLRTLDEIYRATRYEDDFRIDLETLEKIEQKMKALSELFEKIYIRFTTDFRHKFLVVNETNNLQVSQSLVHPIMEGMNPVLEYLNQEIQQDNYIQVFGSRIRTLEMQGITFRGVQEITLARNLDVLLITDQPIRDQVEQLTRDVLERFEIKILILNYTTSEIQQLLDANNPFIHKILFGLNPTDKTNKFLSQLYIHPKKGTMSEEQKSSCKKNWNRCRQNSQTFFNAANSLENSEEVHIKVLLYKQAIAQSCLGLLSYFFDFTPCSIEMKFLYALCSSFWQFPGDIFPNSSTEEIKLFSNLANSTTEDRLMGCTDQDWEETYRYEARTVLFLAKCAELIDGESNAE